MPALPVKIETKAEPKPKKPRTTPVKRLGQSENMPHQCSMCGVVYGTQNMNFFKNRSRVCAGNNGYMTICKSCVTAIMHSYAVDNGGDTAKAMRRTCQIVDMYWNPEEWEHCNGDIPKYSGAIFKYNVAPEGFDATVAAEADNPIITSEAGDRNIIAEHVDSDEMQEAVAEFGEGYPANAYPMMLRAYRSYIDPLGDTVTAAQLKSARFLAALEYRCTEAIKTDKGNAAQLTTSFTKALKDSGFDTIVKKEEKQVEPFGVWLAQIENITPAEYVKKTPYKDVDGQGGYYKRFVQRPVENLLNRASQRQADELSITDEEANSIDADGDS